MTKPPTAERPTGQPTPPPAPQNAGAKGRPGKAKAGRGRSGTAKAPPKETPPGTAPQEEAARLLGRLTAREAEAFAHLAAGRDLAETATALGVTPTTARSYQHRALRKLGTRTQAEIVAFAALLGPVGPERSTSASASASAAETPTAASKAVPAADPDPAPDPAGGAAPGGVRTGDPAADGRPAPDTPAPAPRADRTSAGTAAPGAGSDTPGGRAVPAAPTKRSPDTAPGGRPAAGTGTGKDDKDGKDDEPTAARQAPARAGTPAPEAAPGKRPDRPAADPSAAPGARPAAPAQAGEGGPTTPGRRPAELPAAGIPTASAGEAGPPTAADGQRPAAASTGSGADAPTVTGPHTDPTVDQGVGADTGAGSFEELYERTHTRLVQQTFLLTTCKHRAVHCVGRAFGEARRRWTEVVAAGAPERWVRTRAFELALSPWHRGGPRRAHAWRLPHRRIKVRPADESQAVLPDHDRLTDRDRALLKALRRLSRPQRRALVLHDGLGLPADAVAVEVESTVAAAEGRVWAARTSLAHWVPDLVGTDPAADGFADRLSGLLHRAAVRGAPEPHRPPVPLLRARHGLVNAGRTGAAALLTVAVGGAVAATLAGGGPGELFRPADAPPPVLCAPVPTLATEPEALLPLLPDGAPSGIRSLWCSPTPGLEPVVMDPPPPRPDDPYRPPTAGRAAEALPPPGTVAVGPHPCHDWALHPCAAGR
ncbi:LuxR C-terminal-related transcriptional regulator [Streptomyces sp. BE20]|uniref:sigma factor-like helix-turn-helix DNA-binding protein n=1 Tax=Streptomyces sp. BE20 TaxID=3002525 RepID=UPI002E785503|nr:sigma factor-like helix-turn-helix DNA-binding protein [Streptomyces sp. BE20]MEE1828821.1 LuxR C-terminal-related transcriptional regulator [Streptomyces sp. BE20]